MTPSPEAALRVPQGGGWPREIWRWLWRLRRPFAASTEGELCVETLGGAPIIVLPGVFNGVKLRTGAFLADTLDPASWPAGARVLDLGTGAGLGALVVARAGARVTATDINPEALRCTRVNALVHHLDQWVETRQGDLFAPVAGERFDIVLFNPPYFRGVPRDLADGAWRSPDAFDRFLTELPEHLTPGGRAFIVLSSDGEIAAALASARRLRVRPVRAQDLGNETLTVYEIRPAS